MEKLSLKELCRIRDACSMLLETRQDFLSKTMIAECKSTIAVCQYHLVHYDQYIQADFGIVRGK